MAVDDQAAQGAKASVVIVLIYLPRNITFYVLQGFSRHLNQNVQQYINICD